MTNKNTFDINMNDTLKMILDKLNIQELSETEKPQTPRANKLRHPDKDDKNAPSVAFKDEDLGVELYSNGFCIYEPETGKSTVLWLPALKTPYEYSSISTDDVTKIPDISEDKLLNGWWILAVTLVGCDRLERNQANTGGNRYAKKFKIETDRNMCLPNNPEDDLYSKNPERIYLKKEKDKALKEILMKAEESFTEKQKGVYMLIKENQGNISNTKIADTLHITEAGVRKHKKAFGKKILLVMNEYGWTRG